MKSRWIVMLLAVSMLGYTGLSRAGERGMRPPAGPLQQILEHSKELELTADQKAKIEALIKENGAPREGAMRDKMKDNPELAREMREARQSGDEAKIKAAREKMREKMGNDAPGPNAKRGEGAAKLTDILTREQMQKLREIREKQAEGGPRRGGRDGAGAGTTEKGNKPDASKGVPDPFDK